MAKLVNGIFGDIRGSLLGQTFRKTINGNIVSAKVTSVATDSPAQLKQQTKFALCAYFARTIINTIINRFWRTVYPSLTPYAAFMKANISATDDNFGITPSNYLTLGKLEPQLDFIPFYVDGDEFFSISWTNNYYLGVKSTDKVFIAVSDRNANQTLLYDTGHTRGTNLQRQSFQLQAPQFILNNQCMAWLFLSSGIGYKQQLSNSTCVYFTIGH